MRAEDRATMLRAVERLRRERVDPAEVAEAARGRVRLPFSVGLARSAAWAIALPPLGDREPGTDASRSEVMPPRQAPSDVTPYCATQYTMLTAFQLTA